MSLVQVLGGAYYTEAEGLPIGVFMRAVREKLGVRLAPAHEAALLRHFDSDGSGAIHFGEFVHSFFNRRRALRSWEVEQSDIISTFIRRYAKNHPAAGEGGHLLIADDGDCGVDLKGMRQPRPPKGGGSTRRKRASPRARHARDTPHEDVAKAAAKSRGEYLGGAVRRKQEDFAGVLPAS